MCGGMVDIQSPTAEIRRGKEEEEETTGQKYNVRICYAGLPSKHNLNHSAKAIDNTSEITQVILRGYDRTHWLTLQIWICRKMEQETAKLPCMVMCLHLSAKVVLYLL